MQRFRPSSDTEEQRGGLREEGDEFLYTVFFFKGN